MHQVRNLLRQGIHITTSHWHAVSCRSTSAALLHYIDNTKVDMGQSYQSAVRKVRPNENIAFDRFLLMQNYSLLIRKERNKAFRNGTHQEMNILEGTLFLVLKNAPKLIDKQSDRLEGNKTLCTIYMMKEQFQALWDEPDFDSMILALEAWCQVSVRSQV